MEHFVKQLGALDNQGLVRTTATRACALQWRKRFQEMGHTLKTGDVVLFSAVLPAGDPLQYKALHHAQQHLAVRSAAGVVTHSALVVVVPERYRKNGVVPPVLMVDNVTPDNLGDATDRLVAATGGDPMSRKALNIVQVNLFSAFKNLSEDDYLNHSDSLNIILSRFDSSLFKCSSVRPPHRILRGKRLLAAAGPAVK